MTWENYAAILRKHPLLLPRILHPWRSASAWRAISGVLRWATPPRSSRQKPAVSGPTSSGKTRIVEAAAEILFGDSRALIKVDCAEFQHSHEIAKLIGSPPGYLGHRETHPLITQEELPNVAPYKVFRKSVPFEQSSSITETFFASSKRWRI